MRWGAGLLGAAVGACLGFFLPPFAGTLGGSPGAWAIGAGSLALGGVLLVAFFGRAMRGVGPLLGLAAGPLLGAVSAWAFWRFGSTWFGDLPDRLLHGAGLPNTWVAAAAAGGVLGLLASTLADRNHAVAAGAAYGVLPGAALGLLGGWSAEHWLVSVLAGVLVTMLVIRACALAFHLRDSSKDPVDFTLFGVFAFAIVGAAVCWGADALASRAGEWCESLGAGSTVTGGVLAVLHFPGLLANLLALPAGALGGAGLGALVALFFMTWIAVAHPGDIFLGALIGLVDHFTGGAILSTLFGNWQSGALAGAMAGAIISAGPRQTRIPRAILAGAVAGGAAGALALWVGASPLLGIGAGAVAVFFAAQVSVNVSDDVPPMRLVLLATLLLAAGTIQVAIASKGLRDGAGGLAWLGRGDDDRAFEELTAAVDVNPHLAWTYRLRAQASRQLGRHEDAIADLTHLIAEHPDDYAYYVERAEIHEALKHHGEAIHDLTRAIALARDRSDLYVRRGWAHGRAGSEAEALHDFAMATKHDSANPRAFHGVGWVHLYADRHREAVDAFNQAVRLDTDAENHFSRGWAYLGMERHDLAIDDFTRALEREPDHARAYHGRGRAHDRKRDHATAIRDFSKAISLDRRYADAYEGRGWSRLATGQQAAARRDFAKALKLDPSHAGARRGRRKAGGAATEPPPRTFGSDKERLAGTWKVKKAQRGGETTHPRDGMEFTFSGDRVTVKDDDATMPFSYRLDTTRSPKVLAITFGTSTTRRHIYRFQGDTLEMAYGEPMTPAPPRFTSHPGDTWLVVTLERVR